MDYKTAKIAAETLVDVSVPTADGGAVGCIDSISTRKGVRGARVTIGNPLQYGDTGWYPLSVIELSGLSAKIVVAQYL